MSFHQLRSRSLQISREQTVEPFLYVDVYDSLSIEDLIIIVPEDISPSLIFDSISLSEITITEAESFFEIFVSDSISIKDTDAGGSGALIDSYSFSNYSNSDGGTNGSVLSWGEALTLSSSIISKICFYLRDTGGASSDGTLYARIYNATGTVGSNAVPTGSYIAESNPVDSINVDGIYRKIDFTFATPVSLTAGDYCIAVVWSGAIGQSIALDNTSPTHLGNAFRQNGGSWVALGSIDVIFELYSPSEVSDVIAEMTSFIGANDIVYISEDIETWMQKADWLISINDYVSITETITNSANLSTSVHSSIQIQDTPTTRSTLGTSVNDSISVTENTSPVLIINISVNDSVSIAVTANVSGHLFINTRDSVTVSESITLSNALAGVSLFDIVTVSEHLGVERSTKRVYKKKKYNVFTTSVDKPYKKKPEQTTMSNYPYKKGGTPYG